MAHFKTITVQPLAPARSLLEWQQLVGVKGDSIATLSDALRFLGELRDFKEPEAE